MTANPILLQKKYSRVIECFAKQQGLSLDAALDFFYHSQVYQLIRDGVSDMHCMSDMYLAEELKQEYSDKIKNSKQQKKANRNSLFGVAMGRMHMTVLDSQKCSMQRWERPSLEHLMLSILTAKKYQNPT